MDINKPFNNLLLLPPKKNLETKAVLRQCTVVHKLLARIDEAAQNMPNKDILINTIPLLEGHDSSAIENIVTTKDELFRQPDENDATSPTAKEALRYRTALRKGFDSLAEKPLCAQTAIDICSIIKAQKMPLRHSSDTQLQNAKGEVVYTPPEPQLLAGLLSNWEKFMHNEDGLDPLVRMAIGHYQFEAIHPFTDGNGRTGRILNVLFLVEQKLLHSPILYLSRPVLAQRDGYYQLLRAVTQQQEWEAWILFMLSVLESAAEWTLDRIYAIRNLFMDTITHIKNNSTIPTVIVGVLFVHAYCRITHIKDTLGVSAITARKYLRILCDIGVLQEIKFGRSKLFMHKKYRDLMVGDEHNYVSYPPAKIKNRRR